MGNLKIIKATYFVPRIGVEQGTNVTIELSAQIVDGKLFYNGVYNKIFPDHFEGKHKRLKVEIEYRGKRFTKFYNENEKINLPADLGLENEGLWKKFVVIATLITIVGGAFYPFLPGDCSIWNRYISKSCPLNQNFIGPRLEITDIFVDYLNSDNTKIDSLDRHSLINLDEIAKPGFKMQLENTGDIQLIAIVKGYSITIPNSEFFINESLSDDFEKLIIPKGGKQMLSFPKTILASTLLEELGKNEELNMVIKPNILYHSETNPNEKLELKGAMKCYNGSSLSLPYFKAVCNIILD